MAGVPRYSAETEREIVVRRRAGEPSSELAREFGCSQSTISRICQRMGQGYRPSVTPQVAEEVRKLYREGLPYVSIEKRVGLPKYTVRRLAQMAGSSRWGNSSGVRSELLGRYYPPLPRRVRRPTDGRETVCCFWCGALIRRQRKEVEAAHYHVCRMEHRHLLNKHITAHGIEAPRPLIVARLVETCGTVKDERRLRRAAEECCATEAEIEAAMKEAKWR